jgi:outer membrane murein-binding lipoprotein Lpp
MDVQVWTDFLQQNWLVIVIALVVLFIVLNLVKTMVKWVLAIVIVAGLLIYSGISLDRIGEVVTTVKDETVDTLKSEAMNMMLKEAKDAKFTKNTDGTYVVTTPNMSLKGETGTETVDVTFKGVPVGEWKINDTIITFIETAQSNGSTTSK